MHPGQVVVTSCEVEGTPTTFGACHWLVGYTFSAFRRLRLGLGKRNRFSGVGLVARTRQFGSAMQMAL
jgi:hypothetical protein